MVLRGNDDDGDINARISIASTIYRLPLTSGWCDLFLRPNFEGPNRQEKVFFTPPDFDELDDDIFTLRLSVQIERKKKTTKTPPTNWTQLNWTELMLLFRIGRQWLRRVPQSIECFCNATTVAIWLPSFPFLSFPSSWYFFCLLSESDRPTECSEPIAATSSSVVIVVS